MNTSFLFDIYIPSIDSTEMRCQVTNTCETPGRPGAWQSQASRPRIVHVCTRHESCHIVLYVSYAKYSMGNGRARDVLGTLLCRNSGSGSKSVMSEEFCAFDDFWFKRIVATYYLNILYHFIEGEEQRWNDNSSIHKPRGTSDHRILVSWLRNGSEGTSGFCSCDLWSKRESNTYH